MSNTELPIWWTLDQALIWIATGDADLASENELWVQDFELALDDAWATATKGTLFDKWKTQEGSSTGLDFNPARKSLLRKLQAGELTIDIGGQPVPRVWFRGAEFDYSGGVDPRVRLSRWRKNRSQRSQAIAPDHLDDVEIEVAPLIALFPARSHSPPQIVEPPAEPPADAADFKPLDPKPDRSAAAARREWARLLLARERGTEPTLGFDDTVKLFTANFSIDRDTARDMIKGQRRRGRPRANS